ncbi:MAG: DUF1016 N-terminal domain-containing protein, partial [bacterium]|nr:DUF1016 N-terminal domain-containing protein [bacterium]
MTKKPAKIKNDLLFDRIGLIISEARRRTVQTVNTILVKTYWEISREIVEHELGGKTRADYGEKLLKNLAKELTVQYGQGFSYRNLQRMKQFYHTYSIVPTLSAQSLEKDATLSHKSESSQTGSTASNLLITNQTLSTPSRKSKREIVQTVSAKSVLS